MPKYVFFAGKCILKCPKEAPFVNNKECVHACPYVHDSHLNCMKECPEHTYRPGKQCKAGCPPERPFSGTLFNPKCMDRCGKYELASENKKCIYRSSCSTFIYGMRCLQKCPPHTYLLHSKDEKKLQLANYSLCYGWHLILHCDYSHCFCDTNFLPLLQNSRGKFFLLKLYKEIDVHNLKHVLIVPSVNSHVYFHYLLGLLLTIFWNLSGWSIS